MKTQSKLSYIIIGGIFLIIGIYTAIWYTQAELIKSNVFKLIEKARENLKDQANMEFSYKEITYSGFPFALHVSIKEPTISFSNQGNVTARITFLEESIIIKSHPFRPRHYHLERPNNMNIEWNMHNGSSMVTNIKTKMNATDFVINSEGVVESVKSKNGDIDITVPDLFSMNIHNFDMDSITDWSISGKKKHKGKTDLENLHMNFYEKSNEAIYNKNIQALIKKMEPISVNLDYSVTEPYPLESKNKGIILRDIDIDVNNFALMSGFFNIVIKGECHEQASDVLPHGIISFTIQKLEGFLEFQKEIMHLIAEKEREKGKKGTYEIEHFDADKMRDFLRNIAEETSKDSQDITITFFMEKGKQFKIGNRSLPEVMVLFQRIYDEKNRKSDVISPESKQEEALKDVPNPNMLFPGEML